MKFELSREVEFSMNNFILDLTSLNLAPSHNDYQIIYVTNYDRSKFYVLNVQYSTIPTVYSRKRHTCESVGDAAEISRNDAVEQRLRST